MSFDTFTENDDTSFSIRKINPTTFMVREDDAFGEHPFIYVKIHPRVPVVILSDTGCDAPSDGKKHGSSLHHRVCCA
jgi:hypothetical protein